MNIFKNKILFKLIASICVFLTLLNFGVSNRVYANDNEVWGGILITPITKLLTALADGIITLLHQAVLDQQVSIITVSSSDDWWDDWVGVVLTILLTVAIGALVVALLPFTSTIAAVLVVGAVEVISAAILPGSSGGILANAGTFLVERLENSIFGKDLYLPVFRISPEEIFSNDLMLFDINFFNPMPSEVKTETTGREAGSSTKTETVDGNGNSTINLAEILIRNGIISNSSEYEGFWQSRTPIYKDSREEVVSGDWENMGADETYTYETRKYEIYAEDGTCITVTFEDKYKHIVNGEKEWVSRKNYSNGSLA